MTTLKIEQPGGAPLVVELRDPLWAAFLGWLWPGAGHLYQRRYAKGWLYMVCIVGTFVFGMGLGRGRVVYASTRKNDIRWQFYFQLGGRRIALPAIVQAYKTRGGGEPFFPLARRYPRNDQDAEGRYRQFQIIRDPADLERLGKKSLVDGLYAPPVGPIDEQQNDVLGMWHFESSQLYDLGTLYTMVAGILNLLVVYDAMCGPFVVKPKAKRRRGDDAAPAAEVR